MLLVIGDLSPVRLRLIKFHRLDHLTKQISLFGRLIGTSAGLYDALHSFAAKQLYKETNKHKGFLEKLALKVFFC